ncbi:MAG: glycosyltransferase, partial [Desulfatiglandales bacterium]
QCIFKRPFLIHFHEAAGRLPVVVTDQGGPQENVLPSKTGLVVPAGDSDAFADALLTLIDHPMERQSMKRKAREYVEKRSFESAFRQLWESYKTFRPEEAPVSCSQMNNGVR